MSGVKVRLGDLLVQQGLIDEPQLMSALAEQRQTGRKLGVCAGRTHGDRDRFDAATLARRPGHSDLEWLFDRERILLRNHEPVAVPRDGQFDPFAEILQIQRLGEKVGRPNPDRFDRLFEIGLAADHNRL